MRMTFPFQEAVDACLVASHHRWFGEGNDPVAMHVFTQCWGNTSCGYGGISGQAMTNATTVVLLNTWRNALVFIAGRLAYEIEKPTYEFFKDLAEHKMLGVRYGWASRYVAKP